MSSRCVVAGCREIGEHLEDCRSDRCKGCLPRATERGLVCNSDRTGLGALLAEVADLAGDLREEPDLVDRSEWTVRQWRPWPTTDPARKPGWRWGLELGGDDLARVLPSGITRQNVGARVSGSRSPGAPANLNQLDLAGDARHGDPIPTLVPATQVVTVLVSRRFMARAGGTAVERVETYVARRRVVVRGVMVQAPDQVGYLPVATILDSWVRDVRAALWPGHHLPGDSVRDLAGWLGKRLPDVCDRYQRVAELAEALGEVRAAVRRVLGLNDAPQEYCEGVACRSCDRQALWRDRGLIRCVYCGHNYSDQEYLGWVKMEAPYHLGRVRDGELAPKHPDELRRMAT